MKLKIDENITIALEPFVKLLGISKGALFLLAISDHGATKLPDN